MLTCNMQNEYDFNIIKIYDDRKMSRYPRNEQTGVMFALFSQNVTALQTLKQDYI